MERRSAEDIVLPGVHGYEKCTLNALYVTCHGFHDANITIDSKAQTTGSMKRFRFILIRSSVKDNYNMLT